MDRTAIEAEISAQLKLLEANQIDQALVTKIDAHIKNLEYQLNQRLVYVPAKVIIQNFLPEIDKRGTPATKVDDEVWNSLSFGLKRKAQKRMHEEISFEKHSKGFGFFYTLGEVTFDLGQCDGVDWYARVTEDERVSQKVTGAPVEIKLRVFLHLQRLLAEINYHSEQVASQIRGDLTRDALERFPGMQIIGNWNRFHSWDPFQNR